MFVSDLCEEKDGVKLSLCHTREVVGCNLLQPTPT